MFSEKLTEEDFPIKLNKWPLKKKILIFFVILTIIIIATILIIILLRKKTNSTEFIKNEPYIENINNYLIADFKLNDTS